MPDKPKEKIRDFDFSKFAKAITPSRVTQTSRGFGPSAITTRGSFVSREYTAKEIRQILNSEDINKIRELSRFYYTNNGIYSGIIMYLATLMLFDYVVIPRYDTTKSILKERLLRQYWKACEFIKSLGIPQIFTEITLQTLIDGVYYGILREDEDGRNTIQELPIEYCRIISRDINGLNIPEFNLSYFSSIKEDTDRDKILKAFPQEIQKAYKRWTNGKITAPWIAIPPEIGGFAFFFGTPLPLLATTIANLRDLEDAILREAKRDTNELYKILIQKLPIGSNDELIFDLTETKAIHDSVISMLQDNDNINYITGFGDFTMESVQDSSAAAQAADRIEKYKDQVYDASGVSNVIFNAEKGDTAAYSVRRNTSLMHSWARVYERWLTVQLHIRFGNRNVKFDLEFLPTTLHNRGEKAKEYIDAAKFGYPKTYAAAALGIEPTQFLSALSFENDVLNLNARMIPLQSSYTTAGSDFPMGNNSSQKEETTEDISPQHIDSDGENSIIAENGGDDTDGA